MVTPGNVGPPLTTLGPHRVFTCTQSCKDPPRRGELLLAVLRTRFHFAIGKEESLPNRDSFLSLMGPVEMAHLGSHF